MTSSSVRVGFIGAGFARRVQLPGLALVPGAKATAIASAHRANAEAVAREFGLAHVFADGAELARSPEVDLVVISSPPASPPPPPHAAPGPRERAGPAGRGRPGRARTARGSPSTPGAGGGGECRPPRPGGARVGFAGNGSR